MSFVLRKGRGPVVYQNLDASGQLSHQVTSYCPCFTPGTLIKTDKGEVPVEDIRPDMLVLTRDNGYQKVVWCGQRTLTKGFLDVNPSLQPIEIAAGALGPDLPERTTCVSPQHRMLLNNDQIRQWFDMDEVLIAAHLLTCFEGVKRSIVEEITYVHFMFEQHEIVLADGAWSESYQPNDMRAGAMDERHRSELLHIFPELEDDAVSAFPAARTQIEAAQLEDVLFPSE
ncbi:Hint domain-containing protein [Planktotalea sp.]|uniref:Hint domain-containing protein n=1 Tax=Planktotalea sp. TaxID=2029877 RepID=UPI003296B0AA